MVQATILQGLQTVAFFHRSAKQKILINNIKVPIVFNELNLHIPQAVISFVNLYLYYTYIFNNIYFYCL